MRVIRIASAVSLFASVLAAQQTAPSARHEGKLEAEVHFTTDGSTWFTTNMPAYVALFDVSRTGATQLYPTFSAQARVPAGTFRDVALRFPAALPGYGGQSSSLTPIAFAGTTRTGGGWPHTLLLVASTAPLRVGNPTETNISLNNKLFQEHHFTDVETEEGIKAIVALVSPVDSYADVVTDQVASLPGAVRALALSASYDPSRVSVGYSCHDGNNTFYSAVPQLGASCTALREIPPGLMHPAVPGPVVNASVASAKVDSANASVKRSPVGESRNISDPEEIKRFMETLRSSGTARETTPAASHYVNGQANGANGHPLDVNRR
ncbi:MAG TPA: hypothetical protein VGQ30_01025, partial [Gemmatimonadaceae bacterium]|nr:hypothetical protein [Gemmatimonadaceae bacterium]